MGNEYYNEMSLMVPKTYKYCEICDGILYYYKLSWYFIVEFLMWKWHDNFSEFSVLFGLDN